VFVTLATGSERKETESDDQYRYSLVRLCWIGGSERFLTGLLL
jgi:hypothetical protein